MSNLTEEHDAGTLSTSDDKIERWRQEELVRAGYPESFARAIALRHTGPEAIDLHKAIGLVVNGCPPQVAADILL
jgi:hypothetical protein